MSAPDGPILPHVADLFSADFFREQCFALWHAHLQWLQAEGFERALQDDSHPAALDRPSGHEMVDLLDSFIGGTGFVNAHLGLTSSDICDNVRLIQVQRACHWLALGATQLCLNLPELVMAGLPDDGESRTVGFTHWRPAAPITWYSRVHAWLAPLEVSVHRPPIIHAKQFGGPVGDGASLKLVLKVDRLQPALDRFHWEPFGLAQPQNRLPIQSSDHVDELLAVQWAVRLAAQLHKIAQDWRVLAGFGVLRPPAVPAGSSSMPHKLNPFKWEKVCGLCRSAATTQAEMWDVAAHNSLERTLDTSWQLKHLLERCFTTLAEAVDLLAAHPPRIDRAADLALLRVHEDDLASDRDLTRRVLAGEARWPAYLQSIDVTINRS
jgi:adenylosuccinate lyase